ncbi:MAG: acyl-CoA desaturase [Reichenbachiella sp.]
MEILIFMLVLWYGGLFFQTFFLHRYSAHQSFTMSRLGEKLSFIGAWLFQGSNYLSAYGYGVMHRMHHAYADTEKDVHSPKYDANLFAMMWRTKTTYTDITNKRIEVESRFTENVPEWPLFDKFARSWVSRLAFSFGYIYFFYTFATAWWQWLALPIAFLMAPIHGAIINWFAHIYGYINFKVGDTSKNMLPLDFLMMGESYHNNHHKYGNRANFGGIRWHEIDPTYVIMWVMDKLGMIRIKKLEVTVNKESLKKAA